MKDISLVNVIIADPSGGSSSNCLESTAQEGFMSEKNEDPFQLKLSSNGSQSVHEEQASGHHFSRIHHQKNHQRIASLNHHLQHHSSSHSLPSSPSSSSSRSENHFKTENHRKQKTCSPNKRIELDDYREEEGERQVHQLNREEHDSLPLEHDFIGGQDQDVRNPVDDDDLRRKRKFEGSDDDEEDDDFENVEDQEEEEGAGGYQPKEVTEEMLHRIDTERWPHVNGIYDSQGRWREWHETVTEVNPYDGQEFVILPYVDSLVTELLDLKIEDDDEEDEEEEFISQRVKEEEKG